MVLHILMKEYGGYPDRWLEQDWSICLELLNVKSIIQTILERERKKHKLKGGNT